MVAAVTLASLLADIDSVTAPRCSQCDGPLGESPSDYWCSEKCQRRWLATFGDALQAPAIPRPFTARPVRHPVVAYAPAWFVDRRGRARLGVRRA